MSPYKGKNPISPPKFPSKRRLQSVRTKDLGEPPPSHCHVAHLVQKNRPLISIHPAHIRSNFLQEWIGQNRRCLFMLAAARIAKQIADVDLQRNGEALQRRKRRHCLAILNL